MNSSARYDHETIKKLNSLYDAYECKVSLISNLRLFLLSHQTIGTKPIAHIDQFTPEMLGTAELAEEVSLDGSGKLVKVTYIL